MADHSSNDIIKRKSSRVKRRYVIVTASSLLEIFKDYMGEEELPVDAKLERFMMKPSEKGAFAFVVESPSIPVGAPPVRVKYDIRRIYAA